MCDEKYLCYQNFIAVIRNYTFLQLLVKQQIGVSPRVSLLKKRDTSINFFLSSNSQDKEKIFLKKKGQNGFLFLAYYKKAASSFVLLLYIAAENLIAILFFLLCVSVTVINHIFHFIVKTLKLFFYKEIFIRRFFPTP